MIEEANLADTDLMSNVQPEPIRIPGPYLPELGPWRVEGNKSPVAHRFFIDPEGVYSPI